MNRKVMVFTGFLMLLTVAFAGLIPAYAQTGMKDKLGVDFSDSEFAVLVDLNVDTGAFLSGDLSSNVQVLEDYVNGASNTQVEADADTTFDQQFYLAYNNVSGVETGYVALDHVKGQLVVDATSIGAGYHYFGDYEASAPFQTLMQHYMSGENHVFATNTFRGFVAYTTTPGDEKIDPSDDTYVGYPIVEENILSHLNTALQGHGLPSMGGYNSTPIYGENKFGMHYENMFVLFQDQSADKAQDGILSAIRSWARGLDVVALGGDIAAAALFDYVDFTYNIVDRSNSTHRIIDVVTDYDIGPVSVLITRNDGPIFSTLTGGLIAGINSSNSFSLAGTQVNFNLGTYATISYGLQINLPTLYVYTGTAAKARIDTAAVQGTASGFGISVVTSTNVWRQGVGNDVDFGDDSTTFEDASNLEVDMDVFKTSFVGKSTYTVHESSGDTVDDVIVSVFSMSDLNSLLDIHSLFNGYFKSQSLMARGFITKMVKEVFNPAATNPGDVGLDVEKTDYATFVQMPKWSGNELTQDPTYSVVSIIGSENSGSSDTTNTDTIQTSQQSTTALPGFETLFLIVAIIPLFIIKKRK